MKRILAFLFLIASIAPFAHAVSNGHIPSPEEAFGFKRRYASGTGGGYSLLLNSHMDTAVRATDTWLRKEPHADVHHKASA